MLQPDIAFLDIAGRRIAYRLREGAAPALMFLPGYASDMAGAKALAIDAFAADRGLACLRLDYSGTGSSGGDFADGNLASWTEEALAALDRLGDRPVILIGSSMGGWIALHVALRRPERIAALVGIAAAPDFTDWGFSDAEKQRIVRDGLLEEDNPYGPEPSRFYRRFWESGQAMRLLNGAIAIDCPVRLIHGEDDTDVPIAIAERLAKRLRSADVQLLAIKGGGHRLSEPPEIAAILATVEALLESSA